MSHKLSRFPAQAFLLALLSLLLVFGPTLGTVVAQGLDLNRHCQNHGRERAVNTDGTAYGWKCEDSSGVLWDISVESACDEQYGSDYTAQYSNYNDPNSWYCQAPASQQQPTNSEGRGCDISRFDVSPSGTVTLGTDVSLYGESNCGTTKFTIGGQSRSETGQPNNSMTWRTNESGTGNYTVCFLARGNGGWENADSACQNVNVVSSGQTQQQPQTQPTQAPATSGTSGNGSCFMPLSVGDSGQITAGTPNRLRNGAGTGYTQIGRLQPYTQFTVLDGPFSADGYCWIYIQLDDGTTGYTATGTSNDPWVEWVESGDEGVNSSTGGISLSIYSSQWDENYLYELNTGNCTVENGDSIVANELSRFSYWMDSATTIEVGVYLAEVYGSLETFRGEVLRVVRANSNCDEFSYKVGNHLMDSSGLGNVAFGFYEYLFPLDWGNAIANVTQGANPASFFQFTDNPDDVTQRCVGQYISSVVGYYSSVSTQLVREAANGCRLE